MKRAPESRACASSLPVWVCASQRACRCMWSDEIVICKGSRHLKCVVVFGCYVLRHTDVDSLVNRSASSVLFFLSWLWINLSFSNGESEFARLPPSTTCQSRFCYALRKKETQLYCSDRDHTGQSSDHESSFVILSHERVKLNTNNIFRCISFLFVCCRYGFGTNVKLKILPFWPPTPSMPWWGCVLLWHWQELFW